MKQGQGRNLYVVAGTGGTMFAEILKNLPLTVLGLKPRAWLYRFQSSVSQMIARMRKGMRMGRGWKAGRGDWIQYVKGPHVIPVLSLGGRREDALSNMAN